MEKAERAGNDIIIWDLEFGICDLEFVIYDLDYLASKK